MLHLRSQFIQHIRLAESMIKAVEFQFKTISIEVTVIQKWTRGSSFQFNFDRSSATFHTPYARLHVLCV